MIKQHNNLPFLMSWLFRM